MSIYLGQLGRMVEIKCPASQQAQADERYSFAVTLEGARKGQVKPVGMRTWSLQTSDATTPSQSAALEQFANGAWGAGPFVFVQPEAPRTNLLTPRASTCDPGEFALGSGAVVSPSGPVDTPDGMAARSFSKGSAGSVFFGRDILPCLPGVDVTGSAYVRGDGGRVAITWYNEAGGFVKTDISTNAAGFSKHTRLSVTAAPPASAVGFRVQATAYVTSAAMPAATWTPKMMPYSIGRGCAKAVVHGLSSELIQASVGGIFSRFSYSVSEVS